MYMFGHSMLIFYIYYSLSSNGICFFTIYLLFLFLPLLNDFSYGFCWIKAICVHIFCNLFFIYEMTWYFFPVSFMSLPTLNSYFTLLPIFDLSFECLTWSSFLIYSSTRLLKVFNSEWYVPQIFQFFVLCFFCFWRASH